MATKGKVIWSGTRELETSLVKISDLNPDPDNLNFHPEVSYEVLSQVISRFGQHKPITVHNGTVICGNGVFEACKRLKFTHVAISTFEGTDDEAKALAIADNKTKSLSYFNSDVGSIVQDLMPTFSPEELGGWGSLDIDIPDIDLDEDDELDELMESPPEQKTVRLTSEQWEVVGSAIQKLREINGQAISEGRCIELISADYLSGS
tara:strand:- start:9976 stop:10593 length:618 start_codon:yes stop_codon:yes gene_type:complete